jgi:hypothetical protein
MKMPVHLRKMLGIQHILLQQGEPVMSAIKILDDVNISMWYYPDSKILHHQIHQFFFGKPFRDALMKGVDVFQKYGANKWLSDDRLETALAKEDLEWGDKEWFPRVAKLGWKYWAIVMPEKVIGQMTMKKLAEKYSTMGVTTRMFSDPEAAKEWLEKCQ